MLQNAKFLAMLQTGDHGAVVYCAESIFMFAVWNSPVPQSLTNNIGENGLNAHHNS